MAIPLQAANKICAFRASTASSLTTRFKTIVLWLWTASILTATVGVSVQQLYCYCAGESTFSFFRRATDACATSNTAPASACCKTDPPPCCLEEALDDANHGCTKESVQYFHLKAEYLVVHPLEKSWDFPIWADEFPAYLRLFRPVYCDADDCRRAAPEAPPPLSGRIICLRHSVFRC